ncbi:MAG: hypothetical protein ACEQSH_00150 [Bacteroidia bacterium]|jgi:hypothetical protein
MRTWGRFPKGTPRAGQWFAVETQDNGAQDYVWVTTLIQCLKLILGESPFWANHGIPAEQAIIQQVFPDFYVYQTQQQFAPFFASLIITKVPGVQDPTYNVQIVTNYGTKINETIGV